MNAAHEPAAHAYRVTFAWLRRTRSDVTEDRVHDAVADAWLAARAKLPHDAPLGRVVLFVRHGALVRLNCRRIERATGIETRRPASVPFACDPPSREPDPCTAAVCREVRDRWGHLATIRCKSKRHRARAKALPGAIAGEVLP